MIEMNKEVILSYFKIIQKHIKTKGIFFNINKNKKKTIGNKIKISQFPYDNYWKVVESKKSWAQDWIHMLITQRTSKKDNIHNELNLLNIYSFKYEIIQFLHEQEIRLKNFFKLF